MEELVSSMVRFSAALTAFGVQQLQNAITAPRESLKGVEQMREAMDSASRVLASKVDESQRTAMNSMVSAGSDIVARTISAVEGSPLDPRRVAEATGDIMQKTAETLNNVRKGSKGAAAKASK